MQNWNLKSEYVFNRKNLNPIKRWWLDVDKTNYLTVIFIIIFGFFMTITSSPAVAMRIGVENMFFVKKQLIFTSISLILFTAISFLNRDQIKVMSIFGLALFILFLAMVLIVGFEIKGSKRWMSLLGFTLQPSEFAKVFFLIFNAFILSKFKDDRLALKYGISTFLYLLIISLLILEPDFGMSLIVSVTWITQLFIFGLPWIFIIFVMIMGIIGFIVAYKTLHHVASRIDKFLDVDIKNYQVERSIDAYINGGFFGTGPGNGFVKKFIPDAHTDFIFAVISEEFGIIFSIALILLLFILITRVIRSIFHEEDLFVFLAVSGLISLFSLQTLINIGVSMALLPTKGMTLPFISYGGSSIIAMSVCFGSILALTKKKYENKIEYKNVTIIN